MTPARFPEANAVIAKDHPVYVPMPAHIDYAAEELTVTCCWKLSWVERLTLLLTGRLWHQILTFASPLQPQKLSTQRPPMASQGAK